MNTKILQNLLKKKVSRREFLTYVGAGLVAITGVSALLKNLTASVPEYRRKGSGYGSGPYGGTKDPLG